MAQIETRIKGRLAVTNLSVSVAGTGDTTLLDVDVSGIKELGVDFAVITQALDAFKVYGLIHGDGTYRLLYSASGDYTSPVGLVIGTSGNLTAQAASTAGWIFLDVTPLSGLKITASAAADSAVVSLYAYGEPR